jgi:hypothetical protein
MTPEGPAASARIDELIENLDDWRGETLAGCRELIRAASKDIEEEWKWVKPTNPGVPVWSANGGICTGETYKNYVKLTFFRGAALQDPMGLFNASLTGGTRRAIDIHEGEKLNAAAFKALVKAAVNANAAARARTASPVTKQRA